MEMDPSERLETQVDQIEVESDDRCGGSTEVERVGVLD